MQLKDVIHYYIGCDCVNSWFPPGHPQYNKGWKLTAIDTTSHNPYKLETHYEDTWTDSVKPALWRLESMTDMEVVKLFSIKRQAEPEKIIRVGHEGGFIQIEFVQHGEYNSDYQDLITMYPGQFYYLIKEGFDLFGLIESKQAIDAETLKQQL